jgi:hypothetical protein
VPVQTFTSLLEGMPQMSCMNTMMMNSRQSDEDRAEALEFAIEARAAELMTHGEVCDPMDGFNVLEAMDEATATDKKLLGQWLATGSYDGCGLWMIQISKEYWGKKADEMARDELA